MLKDQGQDRDTKGQVSTQGQGVENCTDRYYTEHWMSALQVSKVSTSTKSCHMPAVPAKNTAKEESEEKLKTS